MADGTNFGLPQRLAYLDVSSLESSEILGLLQSLPVLSSSHSGSFWLLSTLMHSRGNFLVSSILISKQKMAEVAGGAGLGTSEL